jgi:hypothetical protein
LRKQNITDRAKRYRAQKNRPPGPKRCNFCTSRRNVDIDHITGDESDSEPENLMWLCRACNTTKGYNQARNRVGVRTRQYNPEPRATFARFKEAAKILLGKIKGSVAGATAYVRGTPPEKRAEFAAEMNERNPFASEAQRRKFYAMAERGEISAATVRKFERETPPGQLPAYSNPPTFAQYAHGVAEHQRGAHDEGGVIIHSTPPAMRSRYAKKIASIKKQRGT